MERMWIRIAENIQKIQLMKNMTDTDLAVKIGRSRQRIGQIKHSMAMGRTVRPNTVREIAEALEVDLQQLIDLR